MSTRDHHTIDAGAPAALALDLAGRLTGSRCPDAPVRLARLAALLPEPAADPVDDLAAVAAMMRTQLIARPDGALLLPEVLAAGAGHPAALVVAAAGAARLRGMAIGIIGYGPRTWLAHEHPCRPLIVDPIEPGGLLDARALGIDLHWRCAHELAAGCLDLIVARAERTGDLCEALVAARLRSDLQTHWFGGDDTDELAALQARLN